MKSFTGTRSCWSQWSQVLRTQRCHVIFVEFYVFVKWTRSERALKFEREHHVKEWQLNGKNDKTI